MEDFSEFLNFSDPSRSDLSRLELVPQRTVCGLSVTSVEGPFQSRNGGTHVDVTLKVETPEEHAGKAFSTPFVLEDCRPEKGPSSSHRTLGAIMRVCGFTKVEQFMGLVGCRFRAIVSQRNHRLTGVLENCILDPGHVAGARS